MESFLHRLHERNLCFSISFFDENAELCLPPHADVQQKPRYLLARAVTIRHLQLNLKMSNEVADLKVFSSTDSVEFLDYLSTNGFTMILMNDGTSMDCSCPQHYHCMASLRDVSRRLIDRGFSVARMDSLEWRLNEVCRLTTTYRVFIIMTDRFHIR